MHPPGSISAVFFVAVLLVKKKEPTAAGGKPWSQKAFPPSAPHVESNPEGRTDLLVLRGVRADRWGGRHWAMSFDVR